MIQIEDPKNCCGCTACASVCAHHAITMEPDVLGFLYPKVNNSKCVDCGLCDKVCQFNPDYDRSYNLSQADAYAVRHKDINEIMNSRSGAAFVALSDYVLEHSGVVYGVGYEDHFRAVHKRAVTKGERDEFRKSKYVQSDLKDVFRQVKEDLKNGCLVLFSGTPCQTSGLRSYIGKSLQDNLLLVDIVCHGVPSPYVWRDYLDYVEKQKGEKAKIVNFRDKALFGWQIHKESILFGSGDIYTSASFKYLFYKHVMLRRSCGVCHFTNLTRPSDITIGDFWGWQKSVPGFNDDDKGVSLVLVNTVKGRSLFEKIKSELDVRQVILENCLQPNLMHPSMEHPDRDKFEADFGRMDFRHIMDKYGDTGWRYKVSEFKKKVRGKLRRIKKRILRK